MSPVPRPVPLPAPHDHTTTRLETDDDVLNALRNSLAPAPAGQAMTASPAAEPSHREAHAPRTPPVGMFRPSLRPPMAVLTVCDDGKTEGEQFRLREPKFVIGRTDGDLLIPHDNMVSAKHVEITRQHVSGGWRWVVTDLQSTNGLFVRVLRTLLNDRSEILVGKGRYRFLAPSSDPGATSDFLPEVSSRTSTQGWGVEENEPPIASIIEMIGSGFGNRLVLTNSEYWIGTDPSCLICRTSDPYCEPRHARLFRDNKGSWQAEHNKAVNGLWFRLSQVVAETTLQFQVGEQRFKLQVGS